MYRNLCMTCRWEMGDHAPASEARTTCDRKFGNVEYEYIKIRMYQKLYITWRWEMGDHAPASEARTRCDRKLWDVQFVYIEMFEM